MTPDRSGLLFRLIVDKNAGPLSRTESLNNGRILLFQDITGAFLPNSWSSASGSFVFTMYTKEDNLALTMSSEGVAWLAAVQEVVKFMQIPVPSSRSYTKPITPLSDVAYGDDDYLDEDDDDDVNNVIQFTVTNSGAVFSSSSDVQLLIRSLDMFVAKSPLVIEIGRRINTVLKLISDLKCNKDAASTFGDRLEDMTRVLADTETGLIVLFQNNNEKHVLNASLSLLNNKLKDVENYVITQSSTGWLLVLLNKSNEAAKVKYQQFDTDLITIVNNLMKTLTYNNTSNFRNKILFEKKEYTMAVDVASSVDALGGTEAIYNDTAKERALARIIQSHGADIHHEIETILQQNEHARSHSQVKSLSSLMSNVFVDATTKRNASIVVDSNNKNVDNNLNNVNVDAVNNNVSNNTGSKSKINVASSNRGSTQLYRDDTSMQKNVANEKKSFLKTFCDSFCCCCLSTNCCCCKATVAENNKQNNNNDNNNDDESDPAVKLSLYKKNRLNFNKTTSNEIKMLGEPLIK
jgi:hypothetical protein